MKRSLALLVVMLGMVGFSGCDNKEIGLDQDIIGTWQETNVAFYPYFKVTFNVDGSVVFVDSKRAQFSGTGSWYTEGDVVTVSMSSRSYSVQYCYVQSGDRLRLTAQDGFVVEFIRLL